MQLALTPEVLFPLVAGAAVAIAVIAIIVALGRGKRTPTNEPAGDLTAADWTGEAAAGDPATPVTSRVAVVGPHRLTVAEAVAVREADTAPLPVTSSALLGSTPAPGPATDAYGPDPVAAVSGSEDPEPAPPAGPPTSPPATASVENESVSPGPAPVVQPAADAASPWPYKPSPVTDPRPATPATGSGRTVATAVADALAARAAAREVPSEMAGPSKDEDARDRLLAVLLDDPERAVGAVEELQTRNGQLGDVLGRLAMSGLSVDQLARLSGFPADRVRGMLAQRQRLG